MAGSCQLVLRLLPRVGKVIAMEEESVHGIGPKHRGWCDTHNNSEPDFFRFCVSNDYSAHSQLQC